MKTRKQTATIDSTQPLSVQGQAYRDAAPNDTLRELMAQNNFVLSGIAEALTEVLSLLRSTPQGYIPMEQIVEPVTEIANVVENAVVPETATDTVRIIGMADHLPAEAIHAPEQPSYPAEWDDENFVPEKDAAHRNNTSGYRGVSEDKTHKRWVATIERRIHGKRFRWRKNYSSAEAAKRAWLKQMWRIENGVEELKDEKANEVQRAVKAAEKVLPSFEVQRDLIIGVLGSMNNAVWKRWATKEIARIAAQYNESVDKTLHHYVLQINHKFKTNIMSRLSHMRYKAYLRDRKNAAGLRAMTALDVLAPNVEFREVVNDLLVTDLIQLFRVESENKALATIIEIPAAHLGKKKAKPDEEPKIEEQAG